jgi:hypothetical protein
VQSTQDETDRCASPAIVVIGWIQLGVTFRRCLELTLSRVNYFELHFVTSSRLSSRRTTPAPEGSDTNVVRTRTVCTIPDTRDPERLRSRFALRDGRLEVVEFVAAMGAVLLRPAVVVEGIERHDHGRAVACGFDVNACQVFIRLVIGHEVDK